LICGILIRQNKGIKRILILLNAIDNFQFGELRKSILVDGGNQNERISIFDWKDYCRNHYSVGYWWSWRKYPQWLVSIRGCASVTFDLLN